MVEHNVQSICKRVTYPSPGEGIWCGTVPHFSYKLYGSFVFLYSYYRVDRAVFQSGQINICALQICFTINVYVWTKWSVSACPVVCFRSLSCLYVALSTFNHINKETHVNKWSVSRMQESDILVCSSLSLYWPSHIIASFSTYLILTTLFIFSSVGTVNLETGSMKNRWTLGFNVTLSSQYQMEPEDLYINRKNCCLNRDKLDYMWFPRETCSPSCLFPEYFYGPSVSKLPS